MRVEVARAGVAAKGATDEGLVATGMSRIHQRHGATASTEHRGGGANACGPRRRTIESSYQALHTTVSAVEGHSRARFAAKSHSTTRSAARSGTAASDSSDRQMSAAAASSGAVSIPEPAGPDVHDELAGRDAGVADDLRGEGSTAEKVPSAGASLRDAGGAHGPSPSS